ncbi:MAG: bifunctional pyr operon transcriptional regulator/uracil phosphoribosyltransferase PyrR [Clostridia bacterium]|nr:bifunctional pyr operon transcriptional regulator/uracil phosphoribosyltransferase PyrR [Clostridia bacterium]
MMPKASLMDESSMDRALKRMAHEIIEQVSDPGDCVLVGIRRRGIPLAQRLAGYIGQFAGVTPTVGEVDITFYRDDLTRVGDVPQVSGASIPTDIIDKTVVLVDDVIYTGRTARAAMEAVLARGRAARICLAVLIDRGHRELPIRPDFVGKNIPTARSERVSVRVREIDGEDGVALYEI